MRGSNFQNQISIPKIDLKIFQMVQFNTNSKIEFQEPCPYGFTLECKPSLLTHLPSWTTDVSAACWIRARRKGKVRPEFWSTRSTVRDQPTQPSVWKSCHLLRTPDFFGTEPVPNWGSSSPRGSPVNCFCSCRDGLLERKDLEIWRQEFLYNSIRPLPNTPKNVFLAGCRWVFPKFREQAPFPNTRL